MQIQFRYSEMNIEPRKGIIEEYYTLLKIKPVHTFTMIVAVKQPNCYII